MVRRRALALLAEHLADAPTTVLISTHHIHELESLADHVGVLRDGRLVAQMPREELQRTVRSYQLEVPDGWEVPRGAAGDRAAALERRARRPMHAGGRGARGHAAPGRRRRSRAPGEHARARGCGARLPSRGAVVTTAPAFQTAERRAQGARPQLPRLRAVLLEQVRATGFALRRPALIAAALAALLTSAIAIQSVSRGVDDRPQCRAVAAVRAGRRAAADRRVGAGGALRAGLSLDASGGSPPACA